MESSIWRGPDPTWPVILSGVLAMTLFAAWGLSISRHRTDWWLLMLASCDVGVAVIGVVRRRGENPGGAVDLTDKSYWPAPGWYPNPEGYSSKSRWWDGRHWTDRYR